MAEITVRACAKLNLHLRVLGRRADGYHELETVFQSISLADELSFRDASSGIAIDMSVPGAPPTGDNLIARAASALARRAGRAPAVSVSVDKRIPLGAGLGGGSADAAAALVALNELWGLGLTAVELGEIGATVGSDVPFCLVGGGALATSRGERLEPLPAGAPLWFVLGISADPLSTADVYAAYDELSGGPRSPSFPMTAALRRGDIVEIAGLLHNDLERGALVLRPELAGRKEAMVAAGALGALVAGSGPTIFGLARDERHATEVAAAVAARFDRVEVAAGTVRSLEHA